MSTVPARNAHHLPLKTKLGFGIGDLGGNLFFTIIGFYLLYFLTDVAVLAPALAGTAMMVGKIWDAITDPIVGYLSDRTTSRWGRRRPYIFYGAFALWITMVVMFFYPQLENQTLLFIWAMLVYCLLNTAFTVVNIPYAALLPELTSNYHQRTVLAGFRMSCAVLGTFVGAAGVLPIVGIFGTERYGWPLMGFVMGAVMAVTALITFATIREPYGRPSPEGVGFFKSYGKALTTKIFGLALFPYIFHMTGVTIIQGALLYYFTYIYEAKSMFQIALLFLLGTSIIFIPVWVFISKRIGKKYAYNIGMGLLITIIIIFFLTGHLNPVWYSFILLGIAGIGFSTHYVMPHSILPDVVEYDYAHHGIRREGVFYSLWTFSSKVGQALAIGINGWILSLFGYMPHAEQTEEAILGIRLLCGPVPSVFFLAGILVLARYPINRDYYEKLQRMISEREQGRQPLDTESSE
ncbi:MAG: MFS transporter [Spirochaetota bacterium]